MAPRTSHSVHPENTRDERRQRNPVNEKFYGSEHWSFDSLLIHREMSNIAWRTFWIVATIGCVGLFIFMSVSNFMTYARWEIIVTTAIKEPAMDFPTVTFCNLNPYKRKGLDTLKKKMTTGAAAQTTAAPIPETSSMAGSEETGKTRRKRQTQALCAGSFCYTEIIPPSGSHDAARMACAENGIQGGRLPEFDNLTGSDFTEFVAKVYASGSPPHIPLGYYYSSKKSSFVRITTGEPATLPGGVSGSDGYCIFYDAQSNKFSSQASGDSMTPGHVWCQALQIDDGHILEVPCAKLHRFCHGGDSIDANTSSSVNHFYTTNPEDPDRYGFSKTPINACENGSDETTAKLDNVYVATIELPSPSIIPWFTKLTEMVKDKRFAYITDSANSQTRATKLKTAGYVENRIVGYIIVSKPGNTATADVNRWITCGTGNPINNDYPPDDYLTTSNVSTIPFYASTSDHLMVFITESNGMCSLGRGLTTTSTTSTTSTSTTTTSITSTTSTTTTSTTSTSTSTSTTTPTTTTVTTTPASTSTLSTSSASSTSTLMTSSTSTTTPITSRSISTSIPMASTSTSTTTPITSTSTPTSTSTSHASSTTTPSTSTSTTSSTSASKTPVTTSTSTTTVTSSSSGSITTSTSLIPTTTTTSSTRAVNSVSTSPTSISTIAILPFTSASIIPSPTTSTTSSSTSTPTSGAVSSSKSSATSSTSSSVSSSAPSSSHSTSAAISSSPHLTSSAISSSFVSTSTPTSSSALTSSSISLSSSSSTSPTSTSSLSSRSSSARQSTSSPTYSSLTSKSSLSTSPVGSSTTSSTSSPVVSVTSTTIPVITTQKTSVASLSSTSTMPSSTTSSTPTSMQTSSALSTMYSSTSTEVLESTSPVSTSTFASTTSFDPSFKNTTASTTAVMTDPTTAADESTSTLSSIWSTGTSTEATSNPPTLTSISETITSMQTSAGSSATSTLATTTQSVPSGVSLTNSEINITAFESTSTLSPTDMSTTAALTTSTLTSTPESTSSLSSISSTSSAAALSSSASIATGGASTSPTTSAESTLSEPTSMAPEASSTFSSSVLLSTGYSTSTVTPTEESETTGAYWTTTKTTTSQPQESVSHPQLSSTTSTTVGVSFMATETPSAAGTIISSSTSTATQGTSSAFSSSSTALSTSTDQFGISSTTILPSNSSTFELNNSPSTLAPVQRRRLATRSPTVLQISNEAFRYDNWTTSATALTMTSVTSPDKIPRVSSTAAQTSSEADGTSFSYRLPEKTEVPSAITRSTISQETVTIPHSPVSQLSTGDMSTVSDTSATTFSTTSSANPQITEQEITPSTAQWSTRSSSQEQSEVSETGANANSAVSPVATLSEEEENGNNWERYVQALATVAETPVSDFKETFQSHEDLASVTGVEASLPFVLGRLSDAEIEEMDLGYSLADLVLICTFGTKNCTNDLRVWRSPIRGNCVSFNHYLDLQQIQYSMGEKGGLRIYFKTNQDTYLPSTISSGMQVIISDRGMPILPSIEDTIAAPDMIASFAVTYVQRTKISHCNEDIVDETGQLEKNSREACLQTCFQAAANKYYNCTDPSLDFNLPNTTYCNLTQKPHIDALHDQHWSDSNCTCAVACSTNDFSYIQTNYRVRTGGPSVVKSLFKDGDMGIIEVYQYENIFVSYEESWYFSTSDLLSTLANDFGLYTGCSLMTFAEFAIVIYLTYHKVSKYVVR